MHLVVHPPNTEPCSSSPPSLRFPDLGLHRTQLGSSPNPSWLMLRARDVTLGSAPSSVRCQDGVHHGGAAQQVDERHEGLAVPLVRPGLQRWPALLLHGRLASPGGCLRAPVASKGLPVPRESGSLSWSGGGVSLRRRILKPTNSRAPRPPIDQSQSGIFYFFYTSGTVAT